MNAARQNEINVALPLEQPSAAFLAEGRVSLETRLIRIRSVIDLLVACQALLVAAKSKGFDSRHSASS